ncbi:50S ribosomal protein L24 [Atopobium sp. oral taxon 199]|jgi:large subunit ribosomal protein L24|uniref:50S ribosomal protein L24 n=1 Tax=Atopobium sp. oral taxon 199 TaxID=712156 RepID=UPI00034E509B|nr:ribosomal protein L24 [Atopobium sp. oral taxon 199 str. F0494]
MPKMKIRKGDTVEVLTGKDKGTRGEVLRVIPKDNKVVVEGVAVVKRHMKPNAANQQGGIVEHEAAIDASNVALIDPKDDKPTRVGYSVKDDGTKIRVSKRSGEEL